MDLSILSHQQSIVKVKSFAFGPLRTTSSGSMVTKMGHETFSWPRWHRSESKTVELVPAMRERETKVTPGRLQLILINCPNTRDGLNIFDHVSIF